MRSLLSVFAAGAMTVLVIWFALWFGRWVWL